MAAAAQSAGLSWFQPGDSQRGRETVGVDARRDDAADEDRSRQDQPGRRRCDTHGTDGSRPLGGQQHDPGEAQQGQQRQEPRQRLDEVRVADRGRRDAVVAELGECDIEARRQCGDRLRGNRRERRDQHGADVGETKHDLVVGVSS